jgi:DNA topoisomerase-2
MRHSVTVPKLVDAHQAGKSKSKDCTLILTEGDSAKSLAISGLSVLGPIGGELYGVFPLRGKLLNVREASHDLIMRNEEISNLKQILGLKEGHTYTSTRDLRYGHLMIMTDQVG